MSNEDMAGGRRRTGGVSVDAALQAALDEPGDLSKRERLHILAAHRDIDRRNHWELLGLTGDPSAAEIKRAFFEASKQFHPDRHFGKNLGSFGKKLDAVFRRLKEAYDVLSDPQSCDAYRRDHPPPSDRSAPIPPSSAQQRFKARPLSTAKPASTAAPKASVDDDRKARLEARRREIEAERKAKRRVGMGQAVSGKNSSERAKHHFEEGLRLLAQHRVVEAANSLRLAVTFAPDNGEYRMRLEDVEDLAVRARCDEHVHRADVALASGRLPEAAREYRDASDLLPSAASYAMRAAELWARKGDMDVAVSLARRAVAASPNRKEAHQLLAELLEKSGAEVEASAHARTATWLSDDDSGGSRSRT